MAMRETGGSNDRQQNSGPEDGAGRSGGLPLEWEQLRDNRCPQCREALVEFAHIEMWKCLCGFKIGSFRLEQIRHNIAARSDGYCIGNYDDEAPF